MGLLAKLRRRHERREAERDRRFAVAIAEALLAKCAEQRERLALALASGELASVTVAPVGDWSSPDANPVDDLAEACRRLGVV